MPVERTVISGAESPGLAGGDDRSIMDVNSQNTIKTHRTGCAFVKKVVEQANLKEFVVSGTPATTVASRNLCNMSKGICATMANNAEAEKVNTMVCQTTN